METKDSEDQNNEKNESEPGGKSAQVGKKKAKKITKNKNKQEESDSKKTKDKDQHEESTGEAKPDTSGNSGDIEMADNEDEKKTKKSKDSKSHKENGKNNEEDKGTSKDQDVKKEKKTKGGFSDFFCKYTMGFCPSQGGTPLYGLYRYVRPQRVWCFSRFVHKQGIDFSHSAAILATNRVSGHNQRIKFLVRS